MRNLPNENEHKQLIAWRTFARQSCHNLIET